MTFGCSKTVSNILIRRLIASVEVNTFYDLLDFVENLWDQTQSQKVLTSTDEDKVSYEDVGYGFGTPKGHTFSL